MALGVVGAWPPVLPSWLVAPEEPKVTVTPAAAPAVAAQVIWIIAFGNAVCTAEAEVALAARDLGGPSRGLAEALRIFEAHGDRENAAHARLLQIRRLLLVGRVDEAGGALGTLEPGLPTQLAAVAELVSFEIAIRRGRPAQALGALEKARGAALRSGVGALVAETMRRQWIGQPAIAVQQARTRGGDPVDLG